MAISRMGATGLPLASPLRKPVARAGGASLPMRSNLLHLLPSQTFLVPSGQFIISLGNYTFLQVLDPVSQTWRTIDTSLSAHTLVHSDGTNYRLANLTGCPIGGVVTTVGSGYTDGVYVNGVKNDGSGATGLSFTASAGGSTWTTVIGGALNTSVTITSGGSGYTYAPVLIVDAPAPGGIQATATCTISAGAINAVTVTNQGAGYASVPTITVFNDPRDTTGTGAVLTPALTGTGTLTGLYPNNQGTVLTATPTLTASSGSAAATVLMNFTVTGLTAGDVGASYGNAQPFVVFVGASKNTSTNAYTNPTFLGNGISIARVARLTGTSTAGGAITATGLVIEDAGLGLQQTTTGKIAGVIGQGTGGDFTVSYGGTSDTVFIQPV